LSIEQKINQAWRTNALWLWLLLPLSLLYWLISTVHRLIYQLGLKKPFVSPTPVIVIGNITVGGSGKTPLVLALIDWMGAQGIKVAVISRGYGGQTHTEQTQIIDKQSDPLIVGDEPVLIARSGAVVCTSPNRAAAIKRLTQEYQPDLILSDDGLQHHALCPQARWSIVDTARGFGRGWLLPAGFLREPVSRLKHCDLIIRRGLSTECDLQIIPSHFYLLCSPDLKLSADELIRRFGSQVLALAGIAQPQRFFDDLNHRGFSVTPRALDDHHTYHAGDLATDLPLIITTEKDAVKFKAEWAEHTPIAVLKIEAKLSPKLRDRMSAELIRLGVLATGGILPNDHPN